MCVFFLLEYMWHVMVHCKHSRLAKALSDQSHSKRQRGHSPASHWVSFSLLSFGGASFQKGFTESRARSDSWTAMQQGRGFILPFASLHSQVSVCVWFFLLLLPLVLGHGRPLTLQPVHPECVLGGGVGEHHVGVVEHVQSVQGERVDLQLVQRKLRVRVEADVTDTGQRVGQLFGEARRRFACD